ncbi:hypothetical protein [Candidatus Tisiphia endosymbiont of Oplodontha viridula]|uniref:hypothetical protein n=2 Tax=Candidatus Tisiphia TaxID=2996317 RepID=UPI0035C8BD7D
MNAKNKEKTSNWLEIRKTLNGCSDGDIIGLIAELYSLSKSNKDFLETRFLPDNSALERYKAKIKKHLAPNEPWKDSQQISLKEAKKILSDYKKATSDKVGLIDLMVYYVECGTDFLCEFGDMYEQYYISLESVFENTIKIMQQFDETEMGYFIQRLHVVVKKAEHMGWGYYDAISEMLNSVYEETIIKE